MSYLFNIIKGIVLPVTALVVFSIFYFYGFIAYITLLILSIIYPPFSIHFYKYSKRIALSLDQLGNVFIHGNEDQTVSGRLGYAIYYKEKRYLIYVKLCKLLSLLFREKFHCKDAIEFDRIEKGIK